MNRIYRTKKLTTKPVVLIPKQTISDKGLELIKKFEGLARLLPNGMVQAYPDPASGGEPWTIGYGTTVYPSGIKVKKGDVITKQQASDYLRTNIEALYGDSVRRFVAPQLTQNQFDALVSFTYNVGVGALQKSTLLQKVNANPNDPTIRDEFMKWVRAAGKVLQGLRNRRKAEADLYFS